jgi:hypothetical protein
MACGDRVSTVDQGKNAPNLLSRPVQSAALPPLRWILVLDLTSLTCLLFLESVNFCFSLDLKLQLLLLFANTDLELFHGSPYFTFSWRRPWRQLWSIRPGNICHIQNACVFLQEHAANRKPQNSEAIPPPGKIEFHDRRTRYEGRLSLRSGTGPGNRPGLMGPEFLDLRQAHSVFSGPENSTSATNVQ